MNISLKVGMNNYRVDETGTVYRLDGDAYICIGRKQPGETDAAAIRRIEELEDFIAGMTYDEKIEAGVLDEEIER